MADDNVIWTKFSQKLAKKRGLLRRKFNAPVSRTDGKPFDSYYTTEVSDKETTLYGVKGDGTTELISLDETPIVNFVAKVLNSGGFYSEEEYQEFMKHT